MTTPVSGSSLPQARDVHQHNHFHNIRDSHSRHHHTHHHARSPNRGHKRNDSEPTTIVETVSVLQLIDGQGGTITLQTLTPTPTPTLTPTLSDSIPTSSTYVDPDPVPESTSASSSGTSDDEGNGLSSTPAPTIDPTVTPSVSSMPSSPPSLSLTPLPSAPLSDTSVFPTLTGVTNTTTTQVPGSSILVSSIASSISSSIFSNSTTSTDLVSAESVSTSSPFVLVTTSSLSDSPNSSGSTSTSFASATTTTSFDSAFSSTTSGSFGIPTSTGTGSDSSDVGGDAQPSETSTSGDSSDSSDDGVGAATVAGSVLGGVAALACILILVLYLLRWKKRQNTLKLVRGSTSERGPGGVLVGNSGPGGGDGTMSERRHSIPFAIPAALASLTGHKRASAAARSAASSDGGEKGFSKVSGRKLPPVIQFGGDGYSDPRDTIMSEQSIEYRDSQAFPNIDRPGPTRLALGAPMRPDSGIPVYNPGPARTPIKEQGSFTPPMEHSPLEPPRIDALGRSRPSYDGSSRSHTSISRFTEEL